MRVFRITNGQGTTEDLLDHCCFEGYIDPESQEILEDEADDGDLETAELLWGLRWGLNSRRQPAVHHRTVNVGSNPSPAKAATEPGWQREVLENLLASMNGARQ